MVQTKEFISKFSKKSHYAVQFSFFSEKTTWFKPSSLYLSFPKNDIALFSSEFSLKRQHGSNQVVYF